MTMGNLTLPTMEDIKSGTIPILELTGDTPWELRTHSNDPDDKPNTVFNNDTFRTSKDLVPPVVMIEAMMSDVTKDISSDTYMFNDSNALMITTSNTGPTCAQSQHYVKVLIDDWNAQFHSITCNCTLRA